MSCIDAAIISEMNNRQTNDSNSITTKSITCNGKLEASNINSAGAVIAGTSNTRADTAALHGYGSLYLTRPDTAYRITLVPISTGFLMIDSENKEKLLGWSQTITHTTNVSGEIGTFCEATGEIYDGYDKIDNTD